MNVWSSISQHTTHLHSMALHYEENRFYLTSQCTPFFFLKKMLPLLTPKTLTKRGTWTHPEHLHLST